MSIREIFGAGGAELVLLATAALIIVAETVWPRKGSRIKGYLTLLGVSAAFLALAKYSGPVPEIFAAAWANDPLAVVFKLFLLLAVALVTCMSIDEVSEAFNSAGEFFILLLLAAVGMMVMISGTDLLVIYLGLELMAISFYVLTGMYWFREASSEGALKYVLTGLFASALLMYGIALLYGASGTTALAALAAIPLTPGSPNVLLLGGIALLACGLAFKMGAAPFHMWMPDVIEGSPTPVAGLLAVGPKIAVLAVAARVFLTGFPQMEPYWGPLLWTVAALTILWGNFAAVAQSQIKRMLAYSSIAHIGYLLIAMAAAGRELNEGGNLSLSAIAFYLVIYTFMNLGAFAALLWFERKTGEELGWRDLGGMFRRAPLMSFFFAFFMFSLAGIPPTAGFLGKFWIFLAAWNAGYYGLVMIGVAGSLVGAYYYLRVVYALYMLPESEGGELGMDLSFLVYAVALSAIGVIMTGIVPQFFISLAGKTALF